MKKIFLVLLLAAVIGVAGFYAVRYFRTESATKKKNTEKAENSSADLKQKVFTFSIDGRTPKGVKQWHLEGKAAEMVGNDIHLDDLDAVAYGDEITVNITSDAGIYSRDRSEVELMGNVRVLSEDGGVLTTEKAKWSQSTKDITTDEMVNIERENMRATGTGARANSDEKRATLLSDITVDLEPDTRIKCRGPLDVDFAGNNAVFLDSVEVTDKDGKLFSDKLTVNFDPETRKISEVIAEGNVKLLRGKSYTICEKAIYTDGTGSVEFVGKPRVVIAPEELTKGGIFTGSGLGSNSR